MLSTPADKLVFEKSLMELQKLMKQFGLRFFEFSFQVLVRDVVTKFELNQTIFCFNGTWPLDIPESCKKF